MPLTKELEIKAKDDIIKTIDKLIDSYLREGVSIPNLQKYFRVNNNFKTLLKDINYVGRRYFDDNDSDEYFETVKQILKEVLADRKAEVETISLSKKNVLTEGRLFNFGQFNMINEAITFDGIQVQYLFQDLEFIQEDDIDILVDHYKTKKDFIKVIDAKYNVYQITDFNADVLNNHRITFDVLLLTDEHIEFMKQNIIEILLNGIYVQIPTNVDFMGVRIKPHSVLNKDKIKDAVNTLIVEKDIIDLLSKLTQYTYETKYGNYHFWIKKK
jgi:hypothetical protein